MLIQINAELAAAQYWSGYAGRFFDRVYSTAILRSGGRLWR
jgi:hypothetical protein